MDTMESRFTAIANEERYNGYKNIKAHVEDLADAFDCRPFDLMDYINHEYGSGGYIFQQHAPSFIEDMRHLINANS